MAYVGNNAGSLLAQGGFEAARYKAIEGQQYGQMMHGLGQQIGGALQMRQIEQDKKRRNEDAARVLGEMFGMEHKDAVSVAKSVGPENIGNFAMAKQRHEMAGQQLQQLQMQQKEHEAVGQLLSEVGTDADNPIMGMLAQLHQSGLHVAPDMVKQAAMMSLQEGGPAPGAVTPIEGGRGEMVYDGKNWKRLDDGPQGGFATQEQARAALGESGGNVYQDKQSGRWMVNQSVAAPKQEVDHWDQRVRVKLPRDPNEASSYHFDDRNPIEMTLRQAVEQRIPEYVQTHGERYEQDFGTVLPSEELEQAAKLAQRFIDGEISQDVFGREVDKVLTTKRERERFQKWFRQQQGR